MRNNYYNNQRNQNYDSMNQTKYQNQFNTTSNNYGTNQRMGSMYGGSNFRNSGQGFGIGRGFANLVAPLFFRFKYVFLIAIALMIGIFALTGFNLFKVVFVLLTSPIFYIIAVAVFILIVLNNHFMAKGTTLVDKYYDLSDTYNARKERKELGLTKEDYQNYVDAKSDEAITSGELEFGALDKDSLTPELKAKYKKIEEAQFEADYEIYATYGPRQLFQILKSNGIQVPAKQSVDYYISVMKANNIHDTEWDDEDDIPNTQYDTGMQQEYGNTSRYSREDSFEGMRSKRNDSIGRTQEQRPQRVERENPSDFLSEYQEKYQNSRNPKPNVNEFDDIPDEILFNVLRRSGILTNPIPRDKMVRLIKKEVLEEAVYNLAAKHVRG